MKTSKLVFFSLSLILLFGTLCFSQESVQPSDSSRGGTAISTGDTDATTNTPGAKDPKGKAPQQGDQGSPGVLIFMVIMIVIFFWFTTRGQKKKEKQHKEFISALKVGDKVVTLGGIFGTVVKVHDKKNVVDLSLDKKKQIIISILKNYVNPIDPQVTGEAQKTEDKKEENK